MLCYKQFPSLLYEVCELSASYPSTCFWLAQDEAPYFEDVMMEVNQKLTDLQQLNKNRDVPALSTAQQEIQEKFQKASKLGQLP